MLLCFTFGLNVSKRDDDEWNNPLSADDQRKAFILNSIQPIKILRN